MTPAWVEVGLYLTALMLLIKPLGGYMARDSKGSGRFCLPRSVRSSDCAIERRVSSRRPR